MSFQPPFFDYSRYLSPQRSRLLPRRGNRVLPAICCPRCLEEEGKRVSLLPTLCHGITTPSNSGKYYWQCNVTCGFFYFIPRSNNDLDGEIVPFVDPTLPPGPPPSYPDHSNDIVVPMFPSSSPPATPSPSRQGPPPSTAVTSTVAPTAAAATSATTTVAPTPSYDASGKLICPGCCKTANKLCQRGSCKPCCVNSGGCNYAAHRKGRLLGLVPVPQAGATPRASGGVLGELINGDSGPAAEDYSDEIHFPGSTLAPPSSTQLSIPSIAPTLTTTPMPTLTTTPTSSSAPSSTSYARSLNPVWTHYLDNGKDTREKLRWMEDARQKNIIVDQVTVTIVVWFEAGVEPIQAERAMSRRVSKEWRFGEDAFLCEAAGIRMDNKTIRKYCQNPDGSWWWHTCEINHPHSLIPGGFSFFAVPGLRNSDMPHFNQLVDLAKVPNQNILGRNRNSAARAAPASFGGLFPGQGQTLATPAATSSSSDTVLASTPSSSHPAPSAAPPPVRLDPKVLQQRIAKAQSRPLPKHQVEVVIPLRQKRPPGSPEQAKPDPKRHQPSSLEPTTTLRAPSPELVEDSDDEVPSQLTMARRWPQDFSVHEIGDGLLAMESKSGTCSEKFVRIFGVPFVKTTFTKYRKIWNALSQEEKDSCLALPEQSQEALFSSVFRRY
ncbi:hypothetical protein FS837_005914 [Tulasnella sp. UAMH 9824]|nr:hypothetical protein FS837_005914 [Tulasnella sp. UAMH 9824]